MLKAIRSTITAAAGAAGPALVSFFTGASLYIYLAIAATSGAVGFGAAWHWKTNSEQAAVSEARAAVIEETRKQDAITYASALETEHIRIEIQRVTDEIVREVPKYVTAKADANCTVPVGAVLLHDKHAVSSVPAVSAPAGKSDGPPWSVNDPSGVKLSQLLDTVARNYERYHEVAGRFTQLQDWVRNQAALAAKRR